MPTPRALLGASAISAVCMAAGDGLCQGVQRRRTPTARHDWRRTARFAATGALLHGPFFYAGFRWLDTRFGAARDLRVIVTKAAVGQCTLFPTYTALAMSLLAVLDGANRKEVGQRLGAGYGRALAAGSVFWPVFNVAQFWVIHPTGYSRLLAVNAGATVWNAYLSAVCDVAKTATTKKV